MLTTYQLHAHVWSNSKTKKYNNLLKRNKNNNKYGRSDMFDIIWHTYT